MKDRSRFIIIVYFAIVVLLTVGYVKDIVKFCQCDFKPSYKAEVVYGVGIVTGLGCVFGWCDFGS